MARILSRSDVQRCVSMPDALAAMRSAFLALEAGEVRMPQRLSIELAEQGLALLMPALLQTPEQATFSVKLLTSVAGNAARGLPRSLASVLLLDALSGRTLAIMEGSWLTAVRTGAVSGLATALLARPEADVLALFGAGAQAPAQVWAMQTVRPLREVRVVNRNAEHVGQLGQTLRHLLGEACPPLRHVASAQEALDGARLVVCATTATAPLFHVQDLASGTHINAIGAFTPAMCEVDAATLARARIVVDQRAAALLEAGDLLQACAQGQIAGAESWLELGQIVSGQQPARQFPEQITCFKSVGLAIEDLALALSVYARACALGIGIEADI
ncbi:MAG TPA: ornithine cyclodeaminase family protein [Ktedonobacteraceae bacterium]|jgi:ornithine cyclodeaminase